MSTNVIIENNLIERIDYIQLSVSDSDVAKSWYAKHFGFKEDWVGEDLCVMMPPQPIPGGLPTLLLKKCGNQPNLFRDGSGKTFGVIGLHCKDIAQLRSYLLEQAIEVTEVEDGGFAWFMNFFDPDGNLFEVIQLK